MDENRETRTGQHYSYTFKNKRVGDAVAMLILIVFLAFTILVFRFINSGQHHPRSSHSRSICIRNSFRRILYLLQASV